MTDQIISTTETTAIIPEIWSQRFLDVKLAKLPFNDSISTDWQGDIADLGDIVNISTVPEFAEANVVAEGARNEAKKITITGQQLTINKRPAVDFIVTKKSQLQSIPFMDKVRDKAVYAVQKKMQALIIDTIVPSASAPDHVTSYTTGTTLALADILSAQELLNTQNVEMDGRVGVIGAAQYSDIFQITGYSSKDFIPAGSPLSSGTFEFPLAGFEIRPTTVVGNTSYWFHPLFMTMAEQQMLNIVTYDLGVDGKRAYRTNVDTLFGIKQIDDTRIVSIA